MFLLDTNICIYFLKGQFHLDSKLKSIGLRICEQFKTSRTFGGAVPDEFNPVFCIFDHGETQTSQRFDHADQNDR